MLKMKFTYYFIVFVLVIACDNTLTPIDTEVTEQTDKSDQPEPSQVGIEQGRLVGFWDFNGDGDNSVSGQCGNWQLEDVDFYEGILLSTALTENVSFENVNPVDIDKYEWDETRGLNGFRYFSGAIRFKVSKSSPNPLITFGQSNRVLHIRLLDEHVEISLPPQDGEAGAVVYKSEISFQYDTWHVIYFRVEEFSPSSEDKSPMNNIYIQLDNKTAEVFNYGKGYFSRLNDPSPGLSNMDRTMCFGDMSSGRRFEGECDWVLLSNGRMMPENAQYHLNTLRR